jgi:hypothetical protein
MKQELSHTKEKHTIRIYPYAYGAFLLIVFYYLVRGDIENAIVNLGIALIFDPFDVGVKWQDRRLYQRVSLLVHLALTLAGTPGGLMLYYEFA